MRNHTPRGQQRDKPFRDALRMEAALAEKGELTPAQPGSVRYAARKLLERAGEETAAFREAADRLDGKVPQAMVGDDEHPPVVPENVSDLDAGRALSFILRKALIAKNNADG